MKNAINKIADFYGKDNQIEQLAEEAAELVHAIQRYKRAKKTGNAISVVHAKYEVLKERADVQIMLHQLAYLDDDKEKLKMAMKKKIKRQLKRMSNEVEAMQVNATELNQEQFPF